MAKVVVLWRSLDLRALRGLSPAPQADQIR
jgi:hypothetical protein